MKTALTLIILASLVPGSAVMAQESFGRFFSTPSQRQQLDELRRRQSSQEVVIELPENQIDEEPEEEEEVIPLDAVTLRGIVYRGDRGSTAWLNDGNTYEGNISSQYTQVDEIQPGEVVIDIADGDMEIRLRPGQSYEPAAGRIREIIPE